MRSPAAITVVVAFGDRAGLLPAQRPLLGPVRLREVHKAVQMAGLGGAAADAG